MSEKLCPICGKESKDKYFLSSNFIKQKLSVHFNNDVPDNILIDDYTLLKCDECTFEFAYPKKEGTSSFYQWITIQDNYYPQDRWEYYKVVELINQKDDEITLLDVGCGDGKFFDVIRKLNADINFL